MRELWNKTGVASIWRIIKIELNKAIVSWAFVGNVIAVVGVLLCIPVYQEDGTNVNSLYILFLGHTKELFNDPNLEPSSILSGVMSGYFSMFVPMLVSVSIMPILSSADDGTSRYFLVRDRIRNIVTGRFIAAVLTGAVVLSMGYALFSLLVIANAPHLAGELFHDMVVYNSGIFLYGMVSAMWTCLVSVFVRNKYLMVGIPYIFMWFVERQISRLQEATAWAKIIGSGYILNVYEDYSNGIKIVGIYFVISIIVVIIMYEFRRRRVDCGK